MPNKKENPAVPNPLGGNNPAPEPTPPAPEPSPPAAAGNYMYIGASIPNSTLTSNKVLCGDLEEIKKHYAAEIKKYEGLASLFVPVSKLSEKRQQLKTSGTFLYSICNKIAAETKRE
jgi:hypothetical protein